MTAIHTFEDIHRRDREAAHKAYIAVPGFPTVQAKAQVKGFRNFPGSLTFYAPISLEEAALG